MFMKLFLTKFCLIIFIIFFLNDSYANNFNASYNVSTKGIKIGNFNWVFLEATMWDELS